LSTIWNKLIDCQNEIIEIFDEQATEINEAGLDYFNRPDNGWINRVWANDNIRRAHIDVVDARDSKGLWMMHVCIFPTLDNPAPIYGFDVIAGKNKMTGAFHDFSPSADPDHPMIQGYYDSVEHFVPEKQRELPEWARNIFTGKMLAAGNVKTEEEATEIIRIALSNLRAYFDEVGETKGEGDPTLVAPCQDYYCENQQQNPHTANVMKSLGLPEEDVDRFCTDMLFPKLK
jgi:phycocyanobilin:ferredoxin oxidoreductase|tara:strand:- start:1970 stop:2662 length:693 start_codon:yes stop_codon:yes gene_type:complete